MNELKEILNRLKTVEQEKKVFCIGMSKTGTTSIENVLHQLGYRVCNGHWNDNLTNFLISSYKHDDIDEILNIVNYFDAFADAPWGGTLLYQHLAKKYPKSFFILTHRDTDKWYKSFLNMFLQLDDNPKTSMQTMRSVGCYGTYQFFTKIFDIKDLVGNQKVIKNYYNEYNRNAIDFFSKNDFNFLSLDVTKDDLSLEKIISFLGKEEKVSIKLKDGRVLAFNDVKGKNILTMPHLNKNPNIRS